MNTPIRKIRILALLAFLLLAGLGANDAFGQTAVNVPSIGLSTVICGQNATLYDHAGAASNYSNNADGYTVLINSGTGIISLSGTYSTEAGADLIRIYDGSGTGGTLLATYSGSGSITYTSAAGQILTVRFSSNAANTGTGFQIGATYTGACGVAVNVPANTNASSVPCGQSSILYDHAGGAGDYGDYKYGETVLANSGTGVINLSGTYSTEAGADLIRIYDGSNPVAPLATYSGSGSINYTGAAGQALIVTFSTNGSVTGAGFQISATYTGACGVAVNVPSSGTSTVPCGQNSILYDHAGGASEYSNNVDGYTVLANSGTGIISLSGTYITQAGVDLIRIYADSGTSGTLLATYSGGGGFSYTSAEGQVLTVRFSTNGSVTGTGFHISATYTGVCGAAVNVPSSGLNTVICGQSTTLYDHGSTGNYGNNADGYTVLANSGTGVISLSGPYSTEAGADLIRLYAGSGTSGTLLATYSGSGSINYTSAAGQALTVRFSSNGSNTGTGFQIGATYAGACAAAVNVPSSGLSTVSCGQNSILYDHAGGAGNYGNNADGYTVLSNSGTGVISLSGTYSTQAGGDQVRIYAGSGTGGTLLATYSGSGSINYTGTAGQPLTVRFSSNASTTGTGFQISATYVGGACPPSVNVPTGGSNAVLCGQNSMLYDHGGSAGDYINNVNGYTVLTNGGTGVISLSGVYSTEATYDLIRIYAGTGTGGTLLATYSGTGAFNYTGSPGQVLTVRFSSDNTITGTGFQIGVTYTGACPPPVNVPSSGHSTVLCGQNTTLYDHGGTGDYSNNADGYTILSNGGTGVINLTGTYSTEAGADLIRIYAGFTTTGASLLATYSGSGSINYTGAPGQALTVRFSSNGSTTNTGLQINATYTGGSCPPSVNVPAGGSNTVPCGQNTTLYDHGGGAGNYSYNVDGYTVLQNASTGVISLSGMYSTEAGADYLSVYDGAGISGTAMLVASGSGIINYTGNPGQTLTVRFSSDAVNTNTGFQLNVVYTGSCIPPPTVSSFTPSAGCPGAPVVITGTNFINVTAVTFGGTPAAAFTVNSATQITATPASSGAVAVSTGTGTGTSAASFALISTPPAPVISAGSPTAFCAGGSVTLTATGAAASYQWQLNGTNIGGATASTYTATAAGTYTAKSISACAVVSAASNSIAVTVNPINQWTGTTSTDWSNAANWCGGVPTVTSDILIPNAATVPYSPVSGAYHNAHNIQLQPGSLLTLINNEVFELYGNITGTGTLDASNGTISFAATGPQTIDPPFTASDLLLDGTGIKTLGSNATLVGGLGFYADAMLDIGTHSLTLSNSNSIFGANASRYVKTSQAGGRMIQPVGTSLVVFPVGNSTYNPARLVNTGTADNFSVGVRDEVLTDGTTGSPINQAATYAVNRTWDVQEGTPGGSILSLRLEWNAGQTNNAGFDYTNVYVSHYAGSAWDHDPAYPDINNAPTATNYPGAGPYRARRDNITSFSPFTVGSAGGSISLPVTLVKLTAENEDHRNRIVWESATELDMAAYVVERSTDGLAFDRMTEVAAQGKAWGYITYDNAPANGFTYYRLKMVDQDGSIAYSPVVKAFYQQQGGVVLEAFPNPVADVLNIRTYGADAGSVVVLNAAGQPVATEKVGSGAAVISTQGLPAGVYLLRFSDARSGAVRNQMIVKQ